MTGKEARDIADDITHNNAYPFTVDVKYNNGSIKAYRFGLSKRELFSAMAMQGLLSQGIPGRHNQIDIVIKESIKHADRLLKELDDGEKD